MGTGLDLSSHMTRSLRVAAVVSSLSGVAVAQELIKTLDLGRGYDGVDDVFGVQVESLSDIDGDGLREYVVSAPGYNVKPQHLGTVEGSVVVLSSKDGSIVHQQFGNTLSAEFGLAMDAGADVDGDGFDDYVAGAPYDDGSKPDAGEVRVVSGATGLTLLSVLGERAGDNFGWDVALIGDVDGDGGCEVIATAFFYDPTKTLGQAGRGYCFSGKSGARLWTIDGAKGNQGLGYCCAIDDINGDGIADVAFGSVGSGSGNAGEGHVDLVDATTGAIVRTIVGENPGDYFGKNLAGIGDSDGDGVGDLMVSATSWSGPPALCGRIYVCSAVSGQALYTYDGVQGNEALGLVQSRSAFDADDDGVADFMLSSPNLTVAAANRGVVRVMSGRSGRLLHEYRSLLSYGTTGSFGRSFTCVGDVDGDGFEDVLIGAPGTATSWGNGVGACYLMSCRNRFLQANQIEYVSSDPITLELRGGTVGVLGLIAVVAIDGAPLFETIALAPLDANGELAFQDVADATLAGLTVELIGFTQKPNLRGAFATTVETISFR